jgi:glycosyltransferase involved in cell wall biosynthesis
MMGPDRGPVRVLTIANNFLPDHTGGAEIASLMTCRGLMRRGLDVRVLTVNARQSQEVDRRYQWEGVPVHQTTFRTPRRSALTDIFDWRVYTETLREINRTRPDVIHVHNVSGASLAPFVAARRAGVPVVATLHDHWLLCPNNMLYRADGEFCDPARSAGYCAHCFRRYDFWGALPGRRRILAALVSHVRAFISPSQALVDQHVRAGYDRRRFRVIKNGVTVDTLAPLTNEGVCYIVQTRRQYNTLVFAGGGLLIKGVETLLRALPLLVRYVERLRVVVAGGGELGYLNALRRYVAVVHLLGKVPYAEMPALYAAGDLTLMISTCLENSPLVIQQSLYVGTPVIGSCVGGIPELMRHGETGYLIPPGDAVALAEEAILHFGRAPFERRQMRQRCLAYAVENFSYEGHLEAVQQVYEQAVA